MNKNELERAHRISVVMQQISAELQLDRIPKKTDWVLWAMDKLNCSNRTAREYVDIAFLRLKI